MASENYGTEYKYQPEDWPWVWAIRTLAVLAWQNGLEDDIDEIGRIAQRQNNHAKAPLPILDHLLIGSQQSVWNVEKLLQMGVTHVLNMAGPSCVVPLNEYQKNDISYKVIEAEDQEDYPLLELHWNEASAFIRHSKEGGGRCVVHCGAGLNRSGLVVAAEMMLGQKMPVLQVVRALRKVRGNWALMNESFQEQLVALARKSSLLGPAPGEDGSVVTEQPPPESRRIPESEPEA
jgi:hypothetical protein